MMYNQDYKPLFQRTQTWKLIGASIAILILLFSMFKCAQAVHRSFETEEAYFTCTKQYVQETTIIKKLTRVRETNQRWVPSSTEIFDIDRYEKCVERDSITGVLCIDSVTRYDYSVDKYVKHKVIQQNHKTYNDSHLKQFQSPDYSVNTELTYYGEFRNFNGEYQWITSNTQFKVGEDYQLRYYLKSKNIKE